MTLNSKIERLQDENCKAVEALIFNRANFTALIKQQAAHILLVENANGQYALDNKQQAKKIVELERTIECRNPGQWIQLTHDLVQAREERDSLKAKLVESEAQLNRANNAGRDVERDRDLLKAELERTTNEGWLVKRINQLEAELAAAKSLPNYEATNQLVESLKAELAARSRELPEGFEQWLNEQFNRSFSYSDRRIVYQEVISKLKELRKLAPQRKTAEEVANEMAKELDRDGFYVSIPWLTEKLADFAAEQKGAE